jgi:tight adherence protein C
LTVGAAVIAKVIAAAAVGLIVAFIFLPFLGLTFPVNVLGLAAAGLGWIAPDQWLKQQANRRRRQIDDAIPDTIDLLTICLDAGLTFDAAMQRIADKVEGPLRDEMAVMLTEVRYGRPRDEALQAMAERVASSDLTAFVNAVSQSQKLGTSIGDTVRIQAAELRRRRRQAAEEKAGQASLKMLFPMIGCIFPTLFIVLMGPVALILINRH